MTIEIRKKNWNLPNKLKYYKVQLRKDLEKKNVILNKNFASKIMQTDLSTQDISEFAIKMEKEVIVNERYDIQFKAYQKRLKAKQAFDLLGVKNKARKDGQPLKVFEPVRFTYGLPKRVISPGFISRIRPVLHLYKVNTVKNFVTAPQTLKSLYKYNLTGLTWPYYKRKAKLVRFGKQVRFSRAVFLHRPMVWIRFIPKINNCFGLVVQPDKAWFTNHFKKLKNINKFRRKLVPFRHPSDVPAMKWRSVLRCKKNYKLKTLRYFNFLKKKIKKAGHVHTLKNAGMYELKGPKRGSYAAAQDLGYSIGKYLKQKGIRRVAFDSLVQYHFRLKAFAKGLCARKHRPNFIMVRALGKVPHSKGLRRKKPRRT